MKIIREWFIGLCITVCIHYTNGTKISEWLTDFRNYLTHNNNEYQVLLLFDPFEKSGYFKVENIARGISEKFPTTIISFQNATYKKSKELSKLASFSSSRTTMIVIIHLSKATEYVSQLNQPIDFASNLSEPKRHSKCLIVLAQEQKNFTYVKLLRQLWTKLFLDVTILELFEAKTSNNLKLSKEIPMIHQYNPFTKCYTKIRHAPTVPWFPDKTKDLHGYQMKVGLFQLPPMVFLKQNDRGEVKNLSGSDFHLTEGLSKAMNFNIKWISPKNENSWGDSKVPKENSTGHMYRIMHNEMQYIVSESGRYATADENFFEASKGTKFISIVVVVPIFEDKSFQFLASWKKVEAFMLFGLFLLIWFLSHVLHFERSNWSLLNILKLVLGFTSQEPRKLAERIVYGAILSSCLLYSSYIFTAFTNVNLTINSEIRMETIQDVTSSTLHTVMENHIYPMLYENSEESTRVLLNKSEVVVNFESCIDDLLKKKNCSFIIRADTANWIIESERNSLGRPVMKKIKESLRSTVSGLLMERRSPFVERFDQVLLRLIQSGLVDKWQRTRYNRSLDINSVDIGFRRGSKFTILQEQIIYILIFGYVCAVVVFILEVLFTYLKKKVKS